MGILFLMSILICAFQNDPSPLFWGQTLHVVCGKNETNEIKDEKPK